MSNISKYAHIINKQFDEKIEEEFVNFLKLHRLYQEGETPQETVDRIKKIGKEIEVRQYLDSTVNSQDVNFIKRKVSFRLLNVVDEKTIVIANRYD
jgi:hypothetical protein